MFAAFCRTIAHAWTDLNTGPGCDMGVCHQLLSQRSPDVPVRVGSSCRHTSVFWEPEGASHKLPMDTPCIRACSSSSSNSS
jgi:hypothetical protein